ncbi:Cof-type HAD-IIB family hydrolase [Desulfosporosinus sp. BICA1-9]|uniref:Cof-type HAD-IIB family hydrolase n=1 Tax=Desulfosporosinus sp. BICA1-9 TaxID=1531958 RepID=UPI00054B419B|nr:Cof-type HAD-IIB family hydrolase [Desulfosporosinus sp. BICA1-9]KJS47825.1 MAG: hypothetical protein VR66_17525 [Peptococcaceae bacterium BRH_c23]KJS85882.1 MAG: hypothetical protein JL57_17935 [Desulfosporosinus sp. BICA1-9]KJS90124.1 MAG: hypothetical protein JL57_03500 [Desulfosporosinus sp. BICA1-9]HBW38076.1 Cof-type HAD-IIB family hydrolase [Desulfosporosinus sp.]
MFRLVCLDVDGTLVDTNMRIPPQVVKTLIRLQTRGTIITLASGRHIPSLQEYARLIGTKAPLIAFNGAWIQCYKQDGQKNRRYWPLNRYRILSIIECAEQMGMEVTLYYANGIVLKRNRKSKEQNLWAEFLRRMEKVPVQVVQSWPLISSISSNETDGLGSLMKILIAGQPESVIELLGYYKEHYPADYQFVLSGDRYLEVVDKHATKGLALQTVAQHLGISRSDIMAVGDHYNDVSMLEYAGFGVAMGNAPVVVQQKADWVTAKNTEMGILNALACAFGQI